MKILHIINSLNIGGAEKLLTELLPAQKAQGFEVDLLILHSGQTYFKESLIVNGINVYESPYSNLLDPRQAILIMKLVRQNKYKAIHTHLTHSQLWTAVASLFLDKNINYITTEHSTSNNRRNKKWLKPFDRFLYSRYDHIVSISEGTQVQLTQWVQMANKERQGSFRVIPNGIDIAKFRDASAIKPEQIGFHTDDHIITMVGRMADAKDQATIIRAISLLPDNYKLLLIGDGQTLLQNKQLAIDLNVQDRVYFAGAQNNIDQYLKMSDLYVQSSFWEGLCVSLLEAMAAGLPAMGSRVVGIKELTHPEGLFEVGDSKTLASMIQRYFNDPDYTKALLEHNKIIDNYSISATASKYLEIYHQKS